MYKPVLNIDKITENEWYTDSMQSCNCHVIWTTIIQAWKKLDYAYKKIWGEVWGEILLNYLYFYKFTYDEIAAYIWVL